MEITFGGVVTAGCFLILHTGALIYWMAKINTTLSFIVKVVDDFDDHRYTSLDAARDFTLRDAQITAIFKKLDQVILPNSLPCTFIDPLKSFSKGENS